MEVTGQLHAPAADWEIQNHIHPKIQLRAFKIRSSMRAVKSLQSECRMWSPTELKTEDGKIISQIVGVGERNYYYRSLNISSSWQIISSKLLADVLPHTELKIKRTSIDIFLSCIITNIFVNRRSNTNVILRLIFGSRPELGAIDVNNSQSIWHRYFKCIVYTASKSTVVVMRFQRWRSGRNLL